MEIPLPAIAHVVVDGTLLHYVVIHKISKKEVIIADLGRGLVKKTPEEFFKEWTGVMILLVPSVSFKKGKETKSIFERFFSLLLPQKKLVFDIFLASIVITLLGILGAFYFQVIIDDILPAGILKTLHVLSVGVILLRLFSVLLSFMRSQLLIPKQSVRRCEWRCDEGWLGCNAKRRSVFRIFLGRSGYRKKYVD